MAGTTPYSPVYTGSDVYRGDMIKLGQRAVGQWLDWTPVVVSQGVSVGIAHTVHEAKYRYVGEDVVECVLQIAFTAAGGSSVAIYIDRPVSGYASGFVSRQPYGHAIYKDNTVYYRAFVVDSLQTVYVPEHPQENQFRLVDVTRTDDADLGATPAFTIASGDVLYMNAAYTKVPT